MNNIFYQSELKRAVYSTTDYVFSVTIDGEKTPASFTPERLPVIAYRAEMYDIDITITVKGISYRLDLHLNRIRHLAKQTKTGTSGVTPAKSAKSWQSYKKFKDHSKCALEWMKLWLESDEYSERKPYEIPAGYFGDPEFDQFNEEMPQVVKQQQQPTVHFTPLEVTTQYQIAIAGALEMLRFGAMLIEVDNSLTHGNQRNQHTGETLKIWLTENCKEVNYQTAMRFKRLAEDMQQYCQLPKKLPVTLALPGPGGATHTDDLPSGVNKDRAVKLQQTIWEMVEGRSARQLMFQFATESKPRGGDHGGGAAYSAKMATPEQEKQARARSSWPEILQSLSTFIYDKQYHYHLDPSSLHEGRKMLKEFVKELEKIKV